MVSATSSGLLKAAPLHLPIKDGGLNLTTPVVLAPMAGITNAAFRLLCREQGAGLFVSEMVTARALVERNEETLRMIVPGEGETPRSVQLYATEPHDLASAKVGIASRSTIKKVKNLKNHLKRNINHQNQNLFHQRLLTLQDHLANLGEARLLCHEIYGHVVSHQLLLDMVDQQADREVI